MLNDEEIHGRWNKVDQRYADGCEPGDTHDEISIHALINHGPIISDPETLSGYEEYTPTTDEVLGAYMMERGRFAISFSESNAEFDRWLAAHDREVAAQAWEEGFEAGEQAGLMASMHGDAVTPYRDGSK